MNKKPGQQEWLELEYAHAHCIKVSHVEHYKSSSELNS